MDDVRGRDGELTDLEAFARSHDSYRWLVGPPGSGKTALAERLVAHPPADIDVVPFFVAGAAGGQTRRFRREVHDRLAELLGEPAPPLSRPSTLDGLWARACARAEASGRHLLLLVDGLDGDHESPPIAALLPADTGSHGHVLVLSRALPRIPETVPRSHPLRDERRCPRVRLSASPLATVLADPAARAVLGALAVGGPLTADDLEAVLAAGGGDLGGHEVRAVLRALPSGLLASRGDPDSAQERFDLADDTLRRQTVAAIGHAETERHRGALRAWAGQFARRAWPDETPAYLLDHYPAVLVASADTAALAALPSPERIALWQRRAGHPAPAWQEITDALNVLAATEADSLGEACVLAMRRYRLTERPGHVSFGFPPALPVAWAEQGEWPWAECLASVIWHSVRAYTGMAETAARRGDTERAHRYVARARAIALDDPAGGVWNAPSLAALARTAHACGARTTASELLREAEHIACAAPPSPGTDLMAVALAAVAEAHLEIGDRADALRILGTAEGLADSAGGRSDDTLVGIAARSAQVRGAQKCVLAFPRPQGAGTRIRVYAAFARGVAHKGGTEAGAALLRVAEQMLARLPAPVPDATDAVVLRAARERFSAVLDLAEAAARVPDRDLCLRLVEEAAGQGRHGAARVAHLYQLLDRPAQAWHLLDGLVDPEARLAALTRCAEAAHEGGDSAAAAEYLDHAVRAAASIDRPRHQADSRVDLAVALARCGRPGRAERILRDLDTPGTGHFWETLAVAEAVAHHGRFDQAGPLFALADPDGDAHAAHRIAAILGRGAGRAGDHALAREFAARSGERSYVFALEQATIGAAEAGHFALADQLLTVARSVARASVSRSRRGLEQDPAAVAASAALRRGDPEWAGRFADRIRMPDMFSDQSGPAVKRAVGGDLAAAEYEALAVTEPNRAQALLRVAEIAAALGKEDQVDRLLDLARRAAEGWTGATHGARARQRAAVAEVAARTGRPDRADALLRLTDDALKNSRIPVLAARAETLARDGDQDAAAALLEEAFGSLGSRSLANKERDVRALVLAAAAVDPALCRRHLMRLLATRTRTPEWLAAVVFSRPDLAPLVVALLDGDVVSHGAAAQARGERDGDNSP
ncbi:ATP-binding protein [Streptomyces sp. NPDC006552]|uniref:ATP-binding protein n=1 Tax=Streptomyces sp. NPDC006552 TaxID=3157179 RepID=UPI0033AB7E0E